MSQKEFPVVLPTCYDKFQCKGGTCRNTCCQEWRINISRAEYNKIRHHCKEDIAQTLFKRVPRKEATDNKYATVQYDENGFCPFLDDEQLCGLQRDHGYQILPQICKQFPRILSLISHSNEVNLSLDTGCEYTLELLWREAESGLQFTKRPQNFNEHDIYKIFSSYIEKDFFSEYNNDIRNLCIWFLQNRAYSLSDRMIILGLAIRELQGIQDENILERVPAWFSKWQVHTKENLLQESLEKLSGNHEWFVLNNIKLLLACRFNHSSIQKLFDKIENNLPLSVQNILLNHTTKFTIDLENPAAIFSKYDAFEREFNTRFPKIENFLENIIVMTFFRKSFPLFQDSVWQSYTELCSLVSLLRFTLVSTNPKTAEELIDVLVLFSRATININTFDQLSSNEMQSQHSDSLAHMAILLRG